MEEKPVAGLVTAAVAVPLVALCCLGPVVLGSVLGGIGAWLGGLNAAEIVGATFVAGILAYGLLRRVRARNAHGRTEPASTRDARPESKVRGPSAPLSSPSTVGAREPVPSDSRLPDSSPHPGGRESPSQKHVRSREFVS